MAAVEALLAGGGEAADGEAADAATHGQEAAPAAGSERCGQSQTPPFNLLVAPPAPEIYCATMTWIVGQGHFLQQLGVAWIDLPVTNASAGRCHFQGAAAAAVNRHLEATDDPRIGIVEEGRSIRVLEDSAALCASSCPIMKAMAK